LSWNGATEHKTWTVFGDTVNGGLSEIASVERTGFETRAYVAKTLEAVRVEARGKAIKTGVSEIVGVSRVC
jgi:hypothetical protein